MEMSNKNDKNAQIYFKICAFAHYLTIKLTFSMA